MASKTDAIQTSPPSTNPDEKASPSSYHTVGSQENARIADQSTNTGGNDRPSLDLEETGPPSVPSIDNEKGQQQPPPSQILQAEEEEEEKEEEEEGIQYPGRLTVTLVMVALYLSGFLVALVNPPHVISEQNRQGELTCSIGSYHHRHCYSSHYGPVPFAWGCGLVWLRVFAHR